MLWRKNQRAVTYADFSLPSVDVHISSHCDNALFMGLVRMGRIRRIDCRGVCDHKWTTIYIHLSLYEPHPQKKEWFILSCRCAYMRKMWDFVVPHKHRPTSSFIWKCVKATCLDCSVFSFFNKMKLNSSLVCDFKGTARCFKRSSALKRNPELRENSATTKTLVEVQLPGGKMFFFILI